MSICWKNFHNQCCSYNHSHQSAGGQDGVSFLLEFCPGVFLTLHFLSETTCFSYFLYCNPIHIRLSRWPEIYHLLMVSFFIYCLYWVMWPTTAVWLAAVGSPPSSSAQISIQSLGYNALSESQIWQLNCKLTLSLTTQWTDRVGSKFVCLKCNFVFELLFSINDRSTSHNHFIWPYCWLTGDFAAYNVIMPPPWWEISQGCLLTQVLNYVQVFYFIPAWSGLLAYTSLCHF